MCDSTVNLIVAISQEYSGLKLIFKKEDKLFKSL